MKISHHDDSFARQMKSYRRNNQPPVTEEKIREHLHSCRDALGLSDITDDFWGFTRSRLPEYHDARKEEGWDAWKGLIKTLTEAAHYERHLLTKPLRGPRGADNPLQDNSFIHPPRSVSDDDEEYKNTTMVPGSCLQPMELLRSRVLAFYFVEQARQRAAEWREAYTQGRVIQRHRVEQLLSSPALSFFSFSQLNKLGVNSVSHSSAIVSDEPGEIYFGSRFKKAVIEFSPSGVRHSWDYDPESLIEFMPEESLFVDWRGRFEPARVCPGSALDQIQGCAEGFAQCYGYTMMQAVRLLLADAAPYIPHRSGVIISYDPVLTATRTRSDPMGQRLLHNTITLKLPYFLSPETAAKVFRLAQQRFVSSHNPPRNDQEPRKDGKPRQHHTKNATSARTPRLFYFMIENNLTHGRLAEMPVSERKRFAKKWNHEARTRDWEALAKEENEGWGYEGGEGVTVEQLQAASSWIPKNGEWIFENKARKNNPDTRRFVEECKRAENFMLSTVIRSFYKAG